MTEQTEPPITLPGKPSDLIQLALWDLRECEKLPEYVVDMTRWHEGEGHSKCFVCLAGALMARTLNVPVEATFKPTYFNGAIENQLIAIDAFRNGAIEDGLEILELPNEVADRWTEGEVFITPYRDDSDAFHDEMNNLVAALRRVGL